MRGRCTHGGEDRLLRGRRGLDDLTPVAVVTRQNAPSEPSFRHSLASIRDYHSPGMGQLHHVPSESCTTSTAQTSGMTRMAAVSGDSVGSRAIWMGETHMAPRATSGPHHHGTSETGIYIVSGRPEFIYKDGDQEVRLRTKPGDYIYIPPSVHH